MPVHTRGTMSGNAFISGRRSCNDACTVWPCKELQTNLGIRDQKRKRRLYCDLHLVGSPKIQACSDAFML